MTGGRAGIGVVLLLLVPAGCDREAESDTDLADSASPDCCDPEYQEFVYSWALAWCTWMDRDPCPDALDGDIGGCAYIRSGAWGCGSDVSACVSFDSSNAQACLDALGALDSCAYDPANDPEACDLAFDLSTCPSGEVDGDP